MQFNDELANSNEFRNWHFVEVTIGRARQVCSVFHSNTPAGIVPYWFEDPEHPQRALPLLKSMSPVNLGDYGSVLQKSDNMSTFVALCRAIDDLPDPLICVQCIHWLEQRKSLKDSPDRFAAVKGALNGISLYHVQRRREFEQLMSRIYGAQSII